MRRHTASCCLALALLLLPGTVTRTTEAAEQGATVGILESLSPGQKERMAEAYGTGADSVARVAFHKTADGWTAFRSDYRTPDQLAAATADFPARLAWTVVLDGRTRGQLESAAPKQWKAYSDIGLQLISTAGPVASVGTPDPTFAPWGADGPSWTSPRR